MTKLGKMFRLRVHVNKETEEDVNWLNALGYTTTQVVREAVSLYAFALRNRRGGRQLVSMNADGTDPVVVELLDAHQLPRREMP